MAPRTLLSRRGYAEWMESQGADSRVRTDLNAFVPVQGDRVVEGGNSRVSSQAFVSLRRYPSSRRSVSSRFDFPRLHRPHNVCKLLMSLLPPLERGTM